MFLKTQISQPLNRSTIPHTYQVTEKVGLI